MLHLHLERLRPGRPCPYHPCAHPGCDRPAPRGSNVISHRDRFCVIHDGISYPIPVCTCPVARPDWFYQCTRCFRPVIALKPAMVEAALRAWPWLVAQRLDLIVLDLARQTRRLEVHRGVG